ncbi:hybrid sensor histidine kinase/response regulator [Ruficoccus amylovorans]|uniref:histidine kinase n=1 Tax=Ruficoccus amylovorans TaxID=1804625 RepID=A0A842HDC3_9BACT|nr:hybrid sensor histidine kinase/response regulator [Ruficoccus amylovorans]MBC2594525.1 hybrid sensor histidine kinase/response regulator [Ruficoccus amylovorans]
MAAEPDFSMLDLYQQEVETHGAALNNGLLELENAPGDTALINNLMRAAHSLKGAARIIGLEPVSTVAHALEDVFVAVGEGKLDFPEGFFDLLLRTVDFLVDSGGPDAATMPAWLEENKPRSAVLAEALHAVRAGGPVPDTCRAGGTSATAKESAPANADESSATGGAGSEADASSVAGERDVTVSAQVEGQPASTGSVPIAPGDKKSVPAAKPASKSAPHGAEQVVRVSADNLNRLMGLAAETLVETRQLEHFRETLLRLKESQTELNARIDQGCKLLENGENPASFNRHLEQIRLAAHENLRSIRNQLEVFAAFSQRNTLLSDRLYREVLESRMRPFGDGVQGFPRLIRDLAKTTGKQIRFSIEGKETPVDRDILDRLEAPLNHLLRNACDHGLELPADRAAAGKPEAGSLRLLARHSAGMLIVEVRDDGRGVDVERLRAKIVEKGLATEDMARSLNHDELLEFLFLPGFSTAGQVTEISGRGVGLDVVMTLMQEVGGQVRISTELGKGTTFHLQLPITRSVIRALLVEIDGEPYAFPLSRINRTLLLNIGDLKVLENRQYFDLDGQNIGLVSSRSALGLAGAVSMIARHINVVVVNDRNNLYGVEVDKLTGETDLVVRPLDRRLGKVPGVSAASLSEEGEPILILDVEDLVHSVDKLLAGGDSMQSRYSEQEEKAPVKRVLVVDDSITVRETERQLLENAGYAVEVAVDGADGWNAVRLGEFDLVVSDVDMPRLNGYEFVSRIRQDSRLQRLPVIIVSYKDREEDRLKGLEAGADYYLTKSSFQDETFIGAINDLIGGPRE